LDEVVAYQVHQDRLVQVLELAINQSDRLLVIGLVENPWFWDRCQLRFRSLLLAMRPVCHRISLP
jgi:hypothetical protein